MSTPWKPIKDSDKSYVGKHLGNNDSKEDRKWTLKSGAWFPTFFENTSISSRLTARNVETEDLALSWDLKLVFSVGRSLSIPC